MKRITGRGADAGFPLHFTRSSKDLVTGIAINAETVSVRGERFLRIRVPFTIEDQSRPLGGVFRHFKPTPTLP